MLTALLMLPAKEREEGNESSDSDEDDEDDIEPILRPPGEVGSDYCLQEVMLLNDTPTACQRYNDMRVRLEWFIVFSKPMLTSVDA